jgi:predicted phage terminase large subunit-like protein
MRQWHNERKDPAFIIATRDVCLESFKAFCILSFEFVYGKKFIWSNHHDVIAESLMRLWTGDPDWRNLLINLPPRYSKTEMFCLFIAWAYGHNPACENMHLSFADSLVRRNSLKIKTIIKSQFFMDLFVCRIDPEKDAIDEWRTVQGGLFYAASTGGQVTGTGAGSIDETDDNGRYKFCGMIWIDDPLKPKDAHTIRREQVNELWDETIKSRRNSVTTPVACIMQRIHEGDFSAELKSDTSECFKVVVMKALRDDGTSLWPMKHTVKMLEEMRDKNLYVFSAQYQQDPTPKGGTIFKGEWWKYTIELPVFERVEITADTAQKIKTHNDYSVFQAWGKASGRIYLIEQIRGKWEAPQLKDVAVSFIKRIKQQYQRLRAVNIEDKASGTGLIQSLKGETGVTINAIPRNIDKVTRAYDAAPHVQSGEVVLLEGAPYCGIFTAECSSFNAEDTHLHDDQVDAMMDAVDIMLDKPKGASGFLQMA